MRILFLSRWYPYPAINGSKIRVYNLLKYLGVHHDVVLISFATEDIAAEYREEMLKHCREVHVVPYKHFQPSSLKSLTGFFSSKPRSFVDTHSDELQGLVEQTARQRKFDMVIASQFDMAPYAMSLRDIPKILEELEISLFYDRYVNETAPLKKIRKRLTWEKWARYMGEVLRAFEGVTVVSEPEITPIQRIIPGYDRVALMVNGADLQRFTGDFGTPERNTIVYTGAMTYHVNFDAMKFFLGEVFPLINARIPDIKFYLCGTTEGVPVEQLPKYDNVIYTGHLSDMRPRIVNSWVSIVPERYGGGTRIKVLESMALGTPVIATTRAATGLDVKDGHDIVVANTPQEISDAVVRVLKDADFRAALSRNGRKTIEDQYDWNIIGQKLDAFMQQIVGKKAANSPVRSPTSEAKL